MPGLVRLRLLIKNRIQPKRSEPIRYHSLCQHSFFGSHIGIQPQCGWEFLREASVQKPTCFAECCWTDRIDCFQLQCHSSANHRLAYCWQLGSFLRKFDRLHYTQRENECLWDHCHALQFRRSGTRGILTKLGWKSEYKFYHMGRRTFFKWRRITCHNFWRLFMYYAINVKWSDGRAHQTDAILEGWGYDELHLYHLSDHNGYWIDSWKVNLGRTS